MLTRCCPVHPPVAPVETTVHELHGVRRIDDYDWLRDKDSRRTRDYLTAERAYYDASTSHLRPLRHQLFSEMSGRTLPADESVSWARGGYVYSTRTVEGREYTQLLRTRAEDLAAGGAPTVILDENELADGHDYCRVGVCEPSPDGRLLAYAVDVAGDEVYVLRFRDLETGEDLPDVVERVHSMGAAWSADSSHFFYTVPDAAWRSHRVVRHRLGSAAAEDVVVFEDTDEQYEVMVEESRSGDYVVIHTANRNTWEAWLIPTADPLAAPTVVEPRRPGVEYLVAHAPRADGDVLLIVTNDGATEFRLMRTPVATPGTGALGGARRRGPRGAARGRGGLRPPRRPAAAAGREPAPADRPPRRQRDRDRRARRPGGGLHRLGAQRGLRHLLGARPRGVLLLAARLVRRRPRHRRAHAAQAAGRCRPTTPASYVSERYAIEATDGALIPVTVVRHRDTPLDGTAPCLMYAYGSYESVDWPMWDPALPSLLDRGVVYAHAHIRGGGERGRTWWDQGHLATKQNTFSDHIAVADGLADGMVDGSRIATRGLSAGGLLQGAVFSQRPDRWRAVVAEVPFVDVVTTMLDASIPLTAGEWDEWGDPRRPEDFAWMLAYSPYDNLPAAGTRPDLLVTGAVFDTRVQVFEPAKWTAALRATDPAWSPRCLFRVETGAGAHGGPSGRYAALDYEAEVYAWVLERLGLSGP